jgi:hypothetical protein
MRKTIGLSLLLFFMVSFGSSLSSSDVIRVPLKRSENKQYVFFMTFYFENNQAVWEKARNKQIKLPDQLMKTPFIGFTRGDLPLIIQEVPQKKTYLGIPLYVIIDQSGIIRCGCRDIKKVESLINQLVKSK